MQASDVMTASVVSVSQDTEVHEVVQKLLQHRISAVPVVDGGGRVVGIISEGDLLALSPSVAMGRRPWWLMALAGGEAIDPARVRGRTAAEVMTRPVVQVSEDTPLTDIAALLERRHIKRVPVVRDGKLVGIVSRANLLHGLAGNIIEQHEPGAASDRTLRAHILDALAHERALDTCRVNVTVREGEVTLWGTFDAGDDPRAIVERVVREVPGVRSVQDNLAAGPVSGVPE